MAMVSKSFIKNVSVADLKVGDKLLQDLLGYKDRVIMLQGKVLNNRDLAWLKEKLKEPKPRLASERYHTKRKAVGTIKDKVGNVLVKAGNAVTEEALAPLLKEGFTLIDGVNVGTDAGVKIFQRAQTWPDNLPWRIDQFNPAVKVETVVTINDEIQERPEDQTVGTAGKHVAATAHSGPPAAAGKSR